MIRVVIAEDDPMVSMINEQYVTRSREFSVVYKCSDGKSAVDYLKVHSADLLILDVYMPVMNGIDTLKEIRHANIPISVIMVTAANDIDTFESAMRLGAVDYLVKPFTYERFSQALSRFASGSNVLKEGKILNQNSIDQIISGQGTSAQDLPKGIQEKTRSAIIECLAAIGTWMTGEEISEKTGLSSVTVRRYMNHLTQAGQVTGKMNYETGGRPCMLYKIV